MLNGTELSEVQASKKATFVSTLYSICTAPEARAPAARACKAVPAIPSLRARTSDLPSVAPRRALLSSTHPTPALKLHPPQHVSPPPCYSSPRALTLPDPTRYSPSPTHHDTQPLCHTLPHLSSWRSTWSRTQRSASSLPRPSLSTRWARKASRLLMLSSRCAAERARARERADRQGATSRSRRRTARAAVATRMQQLHQCITETDATTLCC